MFDGLIITNQSQEMKEKAEEKQTQGGTDPINDNRLEAVRDLLFGPNDEAYRREFREIKDQIVKNKEDVDSKSESQYSDILKRLEKLENKVFDKIESTQESLNKRLDELNEAKVDRKKLANLLQTIAKELEA